MRHSKRSLEGYYLIDDTASGGKKTEMPIVTCAHCHAQIVINPGRTRDRAQCQLCDKYICDVCALTDDRRVGTCQNFHRQLDQLEHAIRTSGR